MSILSIVAVLLLVYFLTGEGKLQTYAGMIKTALTCATWLYFVVSQADIAWPPQFVELYNNILQFFTVNFHKIVPDCLISTTYLTKWIIMALLPVYILLLVMVFTCFRRRRSRVAVDDDEKPAHVVIFAQFLSLMTMLLIVYLNLLIEPSQYAGFGSSTAGIQVYNYVSPLFQYTSIGLYIIFTVFYLVFDIIAPFSIDYRQKKFGEDCGGSLTNVYEVFFSDVDYEDTNLNPAKFWTVSTKKIDGVGVLRLLFNIVSVLITCCRGYVAVNILSRLVLVLLLKISSQSPLIIAKASLGLSCVQLLSFMVINVIKSIEFVQSGHNVRIPILVAPTGDANHRFQLVNGLELCALLTDFTHSLFGYFYTSGGLAQNSQFGTVFCMVVAFLYFFSAFVMILYAMVKDGVFDWVTEKLGCCNTRRRLTSRLTKSASTLIELELPVTQ